MPRPTNAPSHSQVLLLDLFRYAAYAFIVTTVFWVIVIITITYAIKRDCQNYDKRSAHAFGYWIKTEIGSTAKGCPVVK